MIGHPRTPGREPSAWRTTHQQGAREAILLSGQAIILCIDETTANTYAEVREELRQRGRPIPENDVWIAALAFQHNEPVLSRDEHFDEVRGLRRLYW